MSDRRAHQGTDLPASPSPWWRAVGDRLAWALAPVQRHLLVWREAMAADRAAPQRPRRNTDELAFMPAALELAETPVSPAARAVAGALMAFVVIAVAWAMLGELDIHATAQGKLVPVGGVQLVQPVETAAVVALHVRDGQAVRRSDLLVQLDDTRARADAERLEHELIEAQTSVARLNALLRLAGEAAATVEQAFVPPVAADEGLRRTHRHWLESRLAQHLAQRAALEREQEQRHAELRRAEADARRLEEAAPLLDEQLRARRELQQGGHAARLTVLEVERTVVERKGELAAARHHIDEAQAALLALAKHREQAEQEFRGAVLGELAEAERTVAAAEQELGKARRAIELAALRAPTDGVVQQLAVHTVGGVVTPAQPLLTIVPDGVPLEVEAWLPNKDAGFVHAGQPAEIKLEAFPFTRYQTVPATVLHVSRSSVQPQEIDKDRPNDSAAAPSGPLYAVRLKLDRDTIRTEAGDTPLSPGLALAVEIKTGRRKIIEYVLAPLLRYRDESWRER